MSKRFKTESIKTKILIGLVMMIGLISMGITKRIISYKELSTNTHSLAIPIVATIEAIHNEGFEEITLPGNVSPWHEATIYARTDGYIKKWFTDIGAQVKEGDLLAIIETPELDAQLRQAEADLKTAIINNKLAQSTAKRWRKQLAIRSVSQQDTDEKENAAKAAQTTVKSAYANRDRLREMVSFERVLAPFTGTITARNIDIGSLINAGSSGSVALFQIVQSNQLRVYVNVPQNYSARITPDMEVTLYFAEHPGKFYPAKLRQTAKAIDPATRTLLAEFTAQNPNGELLAGGYTEVHLELPAVKNNIRIPVNTLLFRSEGLQVATLPEDGKVVLKDVTMGRDYGNEVEIVAGIKAGEKIILNPPDALETGMIVRVAAQDKK